MQIKIQVQTVGTVQNQQERQGATPILIIPVKRGILQAEIGEIHQNDEFKNYGISGCNKLAYSYFRK
jgi:hypothetical protein